MRRGPNPSAKPTIVSGRPWRGWLAGRLLRPRLSREGGAAESRGKAYEEPDPDGYARASGQAGDGETCPDSAENAEEGEAPGPAGPGHEMDPSTRSSILWLSPDWTGTGARKGALGQSCGHRGARPAWSAGAKRSPCVSVLRMTPTASRAELFDHRRIHVELRPAPRVGFEPQEGLIPARAEPGSPVSRR